MPDIKKLFLLELYSETFLIQTVQFIENNEAGLNKSIRRKPKDHCNFGWTSRERTINAP